MLITLEKHPYIQYSKYIEKCYILNSESLLIPFLLGKFTDEGEKPVIIACADSLASLLDQNYEMLSKRYVLPGCKIQGRVTDFMNKEKMEVLAREVGFNVPKSYVVNHKRDERIPLSLPWITKPLVSKDGYKTDIKRIYSLEEWSEYQNESHCERLQIQELIDKDFEYQLIGCSLNEGEDVVIPGVSYILHPSAVSNTGFLKYIPTANWPYQIGEGIHKATEFIRRIGYSGLFSMEFLKGKDGKDYFMEMNFSLHNS